MQVRITVALLLALMAGVGRVPSPAAGGGDVRVVAGCDAACALVVRSGGRPSFDWPTELVADVTSACSDARGGGLAFEHATTGACRAGTTPIATRPRGPPAPRT